MMEDPLPFLGGNESYTDAESPVLPPRSVPNIEEILHQAIQRALLTQGTSGTDSPPSSSRVGSPRSDNDVASQNTTELLEKPAVVPLPGVTRDLMESHHSVATTSSQQSTNDPLKYLGDSLSDSTTSISSSHSPSAAFTSRSS
eukprot:c9502_g1_i2.p1 GENE.c9502_g1_i2~~c9502_g1_i2.p1  ORF type:complete len:143 (+),score=9.52 c9502_g1_i2:75-503(+)